MEPYRPPRPITLVLAGLLALCSMARAADDDPGACARTMVRQTFDHMTPPPGDRDPRTALPAQLSEARRRELHFVLWPSDFSGRATVRQWLLDRSFDCIEQGFADLTATQARYPDGTEKVVSFLGGARDFVEANRGMSEREIDALAKVWQLRHPKSVLPELLSARMVVAAAWVERGHDWAANVAPERMREFRRLIDLGYRRAQAFGPTAREHVMGHYVALRAVADHGASRDQLRTFALHALRRFPQESGLAAIAGERMQPKWGGSPEAFERFAQQVREAVGPALGDRMYATLYWQTVGLDEMHLYPKARMDIVKSGLLAWAGLGPAQGIAALQSFGCWRRDAEALRTAQRLWTAYAAAPQLRPPMTDLDARCRDWERTLPPATEAATAAVAPPPAPTTTPLIAGLFQPLAPLDVATTLYRVDAPGWQRQPTPSGEVFSCSVCEYPVDVLFTVGPRLAPTAPFDTHERFLASLESPESRLGTAKAHTEQSLDAIGARPGYEMNDAATGFATIGGIKAFRYESVMRFARRTLRVTTFELLHKQRMLRIAINRADGPVGSKEEAALSALVGGVVLAP
jgi:hypothetical protein